MPSLIPAPSPGHTHWHMDTLTTNTLNIELVWCMAICQSSSVLFLCVLK